MARELPLAHKKFETGEDYSSELLTESTLLQCLERVHSLKRIWQHKVREFFTNGKIERGCSTSGPNVENSQKQI